MPALELLPTVSKLGAKGGLLILLFRTKKTLCDSYSSSTALGSLCLVLLAGGFGPGTTNDMILPTATAAAKRGKQRPNWVWWLFMWLHGGVSI